MYETSSRWHFYYLYFFVYKTVTTMLENSNIKVKKRNTYCNFNVLNKYSVSTNKITNGSRFKTKNKKKNISEKEKQVLGK